MNDRETTASDRSIDPPAAAGPRRRRRITIGVLTLGALATGGVVLAATSANASGPGASGSDSSGSGTASTSGSATTCTPGDDIDGLVTASSSSSVTVRDLLGTSRTYAIDSATTIHRGPSTKTSSSSLTTGDHVNVRGTKSNGAYTADDIDVRGASIDGSVSGITAGSITVTDRDGFSRAIVTDTDTTYTKSGKSISRNALRTGTALHAEGSVDSDHTALDADSITELTEGSGPDGRPAAPMPGSRPAAAKTDKSGAKQAAPPAPRAGLCGPASGPPAAGRADAGPAGGPGRSPNGGPADAPSGAPAAPSSPSRASGSSGAPSAHSAHSTHSTPSGSATA